MSIETLSMLPLLEEVDERGMVMASHSARISSRRTSASEYTRSTEMSSISTNLEVVNGMTQVRQRCEDGKHDAWEMVWLHKGRLYRVVWRGFWVIVAILCSR